MTLRLNSNYPITIDSKGLFIRNRGVPLNQILVEITEIFWMKLTFYIKTLLNGIVG